MAVEMVGVYTLAIGDEDEPTTVSVHATAEAAWKALDKEIRSRCRMRPRPRRVTNPDAATRLADAWRDGNPESRFWLIRPHQISVTVPDRGRPVVRAS